MRSILGRSAPLLALLVLGACGKVAPEPAATATPTPAPSPALAPVATPGPIAAPAPTPTPTAKAVPTPTPSPAPTARPKPEKHLQAIGTEPFWSVDVMPKGRLKYANPDMLNGVIVSAVEKRQGGRITYKARLNGRPFTLDLVPVKCSDGMSDVVYPWTVTFVHSGRTDHGCARMR